MSKIIIKEEFEILSGVTNYFETNPFTGDNVEDYQSILMNLKLMKNNVKHFSKDRIYLEFSNFQTIKSKIKVTASEKYPLHISYIKKKKQILVNLHPLAKSEISEVNPKILYALLVYGDTFSYFIENPSSFHEQYVQYIVSYMMTLFVRLFGRKYGFLGNRQDRIPQLRFVLSCYILCSFFGHKNDDVMRMESSKLSGISHSFLPDDFSKYNLSSIKIFISLLSTLDIMPGITIYEFTSVINRLLGMHALPMFEDCSRFLAIAMASTVPSVQILPNYLYTYNTDIFLKIINVIKGEMK